MKTKHYILPLALLFLILASCTKEPEAPQTDNGGMSQYNEHEWYWDDSTKANVQIFQ